MKDFHTKQRPILGLTGSGGGLGFAAAKAPNPYDEAVFTSPGTWVAPDGAAESGIAVFVVAAGQDDGKTSLKKGGGTAWGNNIPVTAGVSYPVTVGGHASGSYFSTPTNPTGIVKATGTGNQGPESDGGYDGGNGGVYTNGWHASGGGGAAGYFGNGGRGGGGNTNGSSVGGSGGSGGGGNGYLPKFTAGQQGGGVGIFGPGPNGPSGGGAGSIIPGGGPQNSPYQFTAFGGAAGTGESPAPTGSQPGAVRIIWGGKVGDRQFPGTKVNYSPNYNA